MGKNEVYEANTGQVVGMFVSMRKDTDSVWFPDIHQIFFLRVASGFWCNQL